MIRRTIELIAGTKKSGEPVHEDVLVDEVQPGVYRVVATPGLVLGVARDDEIEVRDSRPVVLRRGGFVSLQIHGPHQIADGLRGRVEDLGGMLDSRAGRLTVFSIPVAVGFAAIERVVSDLEGTDAQWFYGNVYADDGVTPLNWWSADSAS